MFMTHTALELHVNTRLAELRGVRGGLATEPRPERPNAPAPTRELPLPVGSPTT